jgi:hypothetical protein
LELITSSDDSYHHTGGAVSGFPKFGLLLSPENPDALLCSSQGYQRDKIVTILELITSSDDSYYHTGGAISGFPKFGLILIPENPDALLCSSQGYQRDKIATIFAG